MGEKMAVDVFYAAVIVTNSCYTSMDCTALYETVNGP